LQIKKKIIAGICIESFKRCFVRLWIPVWFWAQEVSDYSRMHQHCTKRFMMEKTHELIVSQKIKILANSFITVAEKSLQRPERSKGILF